MDDRTWALAGGTDLVMMRRSSVVSPVRIVDVKHVAELQELVENEGLSVGAAVTIERVAGLDAARFGALVDGARVLGAPQTRTRATLAGNVCRASPAGDTLAALIVHDAEIELVSAEGRRVVGIREFFVGPGQTLRRPDELATRLLIPQPEGTSAYERQTYRRWLDLAVAGVAVRVVLDAEGVCTAAAVAVVAMAPTPLDVPTAAAELVGTRPDCKAVIRVSSAIHAAVDPISDVRGTREYRLHVIPSLVRRAVERAVERGKAHSS
jgi:carbon-monoxide dehydrogenase medium subunit